MQKLNLQSNNRCFDGEQRYYTHESSSTGTSMTFSIYLPDEAVAGKTCPAIMYLSGLTCSPDNVTLKAHFQRLCSELGMIFIAPDTSPKGEDVADDDRYYVGQAASFYVDATKEPWRDTYQMETYIVEEFYDLVRHYFPINSVGIMGHSMGGHGALTFGFKYPSKYVSVSAIAPVCVASESEWGHIALSAYLDDEQQTSYDATKMIRKMGRQYDSILVDQGNDDEFYHQGNLKPEALHKVCREVEQPLTLRYHAGFDHSYYFIQTVIEDHITHHFNAAMNFS